mmetsp:Transcript_2973/g.12042  ORF Transcript_2973/g.12042 Transcript_2973/m.12042 type:complete len:255 (+) Transcript_2973:574-1338(+)
MREEQDVRRRPPEVVRQHVKDVVRRPIGEHDIADHADAEVQAGHAGGREQQRPRKVADVPHLRHHLRIDLLPAGGEQEGAHGGREGQQVAAALLVVVELVRGLSSDNGACADGQDHENRGAAEDGHEGHAVQRAKLIAEHQHARSQCPRHRTAQVDGEDRLLDGLGQHQEVVRAGQEDVEVHGEVGGVRKPVAPPEQRVEQLSIRAGRHIPRSDVPEAVAHLPQHQAGDHVERDEQPEEHQARVAAHSPHRPGQ